jgi:hypothetical protein
MEAADVFLTIAEISVAFAGFAGIVAVIGRRASGEWRTGDLLRFWQMIEVSLLALIFALLPFVFYHAEVAVATTWASCSGMLALASGLQMTRATFRTLRVWRSDETVSLIFSGVFVLIGIVVILILVGNALGIVYQRSVAPYLFGIFWHLCLAAVLFWRLLKFSSIPYVAKKG